MKVNHKMDALTQESTPPNNSHNKDTQPKSNGTIVHHSPGPDDDRVPPSPSSQVPTSTSEYDSSLLDFTDTASNPSSAMTKSFKPEEERDNSSSRTPGQSRMKQLLAKRHGRKQSKWLLGARRLKLLQEAKEKLKQSDYEAARLSSRLDILNIFVDHSLVDESFLGKREINPWRFKNPNMERKYNFVNNLVTTQEMLVIVEDAKDRKRKKEEELRAQLQEKEKADGRTKEPEKQEGNSNNKTAEHVNFNGEVEVIASDKEDDEIKNVGLNDGEIKEEQTRKKKSKSSRTTSASSNHIIYAFGSSHDKRACFYCGSIKCKGQINRARMNMNGTKHLDNITQRISDFRGIYQKEEWSVKYNKKIRDRIRTLDKELNDKMANSRTSMQRWKD